MVTYNYSPDVEIPSICKQFGWEEVRSDEDGVGCSMRDTGCYYILVSVWPDIAVENSNIHKYNVTLMDEDGYAMENTKGNYCQAIDNENELTEFVEDLIVYAEAASID